jgi:hypothetical protein
MSAPLSLVREPATTEAPPEPPPRTSEATWLLCAGVHMFDDVCDWIVDHFRKDPHHAMAPSYAVDAGHLLGEARTAHRRKAIRDVLLTVAAVAVIVAVESMVHPGARRELATTLAVLALLIVIAGYLVRRLGRERLLRLAGRRYQGRKGAAVDDVIVTAALVIVSLWYLISAASGSGELIVIAAALPLAWVVVAADHYLAEAAADRLTTTGPQRSRVREDLAKTQAPDRNVIVYNSARGYTQPFVGSGLLLHSWSINVDVSRGKPDAGGTRRTPGPVLEGEMHRRVLEAALRSEVPKLWCGERTYVDGHAFRAAARRPADRGTRGVPWPYTHARGGESVARARGRELCRDYVCVQIPSWGDLIVTLLIRAEISGANLHLTNKICLLPPLSRQLHAMALDLPRHHLTRAASVIGYATRRVLPMLAMAPYRLLCHAGRPGRRLVARGSQRLRIRLDSRFDFGAMYSVREYWAAEYLHSNAIDDIEHQVSLLETELTGTVRGYLEEQGVDTAVLEQSITAMFSSQQNTFSNIGNLAFGRDSYAGDTQVNHTQPASTAPQQKAAPATPPQSGEAT